MSIENINPLACPICGVTTNYVYKIKQSDKAVLLWYMCPCGVAFNQQKSDLSVYDDKYYEEYTEPRSVAVLNHLPVTYAQIIEDTTNGRKMLDVGFGRPVHMQFMNNRGWLTWGIDINAQQTANCIKADFETFDFSKKVKLGNDKKHTKLDLKFDLIWCTRTLSTFNDPLQILKKVSNLLEEGGVVFLTVPDIEFIYKCGVGNFQHFRKENHVLWSKRAITRELEKIGFEIILAKRNFSASYPEFYDCHIIAQKKYF